MKTDKLESLYTHIEEKRVLRDFEGIFHYASLLYTASREQNNDHYLIISCYFLGSSYFNTGVYDKAMKYLQEGIRIGEHAPYPFFQMMCYNLAGMVSGTLGDDIMSVEYMLKSYYIALDHQELGYLYIILNNLVYSFLTLVIMKSQRNISPMPLKSAESVAIMILKSMMASISSI